MNRERELAHTYIEKVTAKDTITEQEVAYWNYKLHIDYLKKNNEEYNSMLKGLVQLIHKEEMKNY